MKHWYLILVLGLVLSIGGVWFSLERWLPSPEKSVAVTQEPARVVVSQMVDKSLDVSKRQSNPVYEIPAQSVSDYVAADEAEGTFDPSAEDEAYLRVAATIHDLQSALMNEPESAERNQAVGRMQQLLLDTSLQDRQALASVVDAFRTNLTTVVGDRLRSILAEIKDPEVEALGHELVVSLDHGEKIVGLDLLADLGIPNEATLDLTIQTLESSQDNPDVLLAAMNAMPEVPQSRVGTDAIIQVLVDLTRHPDDGVRSASIFEIAKWAKTADQLGPVRTALRSDSVDDRVSAAMALQNSPVVSDALRDELIARMVDKNELWEVRRMAADSLTRFSLDDEQFEQFETFKEEQVTVSDGG